MSEEPSGSVNLQPLILRANRFLGATLVDIEMISFSDLEQASEFLLERLQTKDLSKASLISILQELKVLDENALIRYQVDEHKLGVFDASSVPPVDQPEIKPEVCWATWTVPYDFQEGMWFMASAYYMSKPAREFWEKRLSAPIEWCVSESRQIAQAIGKLSVEA